jgi:hypothetical protein
MGASVSADSRARSFLLLQMITGKRKLKLNGRKTQS